MLVDRESCNATSLAVVAANVILLAAMAVWCQGCDVHSSRNTGEVEQRKSNSADASKNPPNTIMLGEGEVAKDITRASDRVMVISESGHIYQIDADKHRSQRVQACDRPLSVAGAAEPHNIIAGGQGTPWYITSASCSARTLPGALTRISISPEKGVLDVLAAPEELRNSGVRLAHVQGDGARLAAVYGYADVVIWARRRGGNMKRVDHYTIEGGKPILALQFLGTEPWGVAFGLSLGKERVRLVKRNGETIWVGQGEGGASAMAYQKEGERLATGNFSDEKNGIIVYDCSGGKVSERARVPLEQVKVTALAWGRSNNVLFVGGIESSGPLHDPQMQFSLWKITIAQGKSETSHVSKIKDFAKVVNDIVVAGQKLVVVCDAEENEDSNVFVVSTAGDVDAEPGETEIP